jgi:hypothetical protein
MLVDSSIFLSLFSDSIGIAIIFLETTRYLVIFLMIAIEKCPNAAAAGGIRIGKNPNAQLIYVALLYTFLTSDNPKLSVF